MKRLILSTVCMLFCATGLWARTLVVDEWKKFTNIQAIPATGVNEATVENTVEKSEVKKIIDRNGIIYIEKDGTRYFLNGVKVK